MSATIADMVTSGRVGTFCSAAGTGTTLTSSDVEAQAARIGGLLVERRTRPRPIVAILMPHGPHLVSALLGAMCHGAAAPLNPKLSSNEISTVLSDLRADILLTVPGFHRGGEAAARDLDLPVADVSDLNRYPHIESTVEAHDVALLLHTSGTTARPKLVPLTHSNLYSSATAVASSMQLSHDDLGLAVMPLFHIHGIVGVLLSSLSVGAQIHVAGFDALTLQSTLAKTGVTWASAVPTMYQAMLRRPARPGTTKLRAVRSSSAALHREVWTQLEDRLGCVVVNSYGMTEASHQIASTSTDRTPHEIGTVGHPAGAEVSVLGPDGAIGSVGTGEFVVRGGGLTAGYMSPLGANDDAFVDGWFRTGDTGSVDSDGRVRLLGRLKELVNVGGEKVSPFEVEAVLLAHPLVVEAVSFAMPSRSTGEEVHAAVTLAGETDEHELRGFARSRLARFKTPARIHIVAEIPKGATGKVQRNFLAGQLGL